MLQFASGHAEVDPNIDLLDAQSVLRVTVDAGSDVGAHWLYGQAVVQATQADGSEDARGDRPADVARAERRPGVPARHPLRGAFKRGRERD